MPNNPYERGEIPHNVVRGEYHLSSGSGAVSDNIAPKTQSGDIVGNPAYPVPGAPALINGNGVWGAFPMIMVQNSQFPMENPSGYIYRDKLVYRSDMYGGRDGPNYRSLPSSVTSPTSRYRFLDGRQGDVYG